MAAPRISRTSTRRFAWLLWVMLLLPIAQTAAMWHGASHGVQAVQQDAPASNKPLPQADHCDLCLMAAAIQGGALPSAPPWLPFPSVRHEAPLTVFVTGWPGTPARPYRSRAPPPFSSL